MAIYFLDTSALKHRYIGGPHAQRIRQLVSDSRHEHHVAELTVVEIASALASSCRTLGLKVAEYDEMDGAFFEDLAVGRLIVRTASQRDARRARHLLRFAGVIKGRNLQASDALIAASCLTLAQERRERVRFYTADWGLYAVARDVDAFRAALCLRYVGTPKGGTAGQTC